MKRVLFISFILLAFAACQPTISNNSNLSTKPTPVSHHIVYTVTGTYPTAYLTYQNSDKGLGMVDASLPWSYTFYTLEEYTLLNIKAQLDSILTNTVTVTLTVDGTILQSSTSTGSYATAAASGSVN